MGSTPEQFNQQSENPEVLKSFDVVGPDGEKHHQELWRMERSAANQKDSGVFEAVYEKTERGWKEVPFSECKILEEDKDKGTRRIVYKKVAKSGKMPNPNEEGVFFFTAEQELRNGEWVTTKEARIEEKSKEVM